ncbi:hypothetical protein E4U37_002031 [Claviceps purpurea]|nr:hypothetical protein E4U37_002031 [Claviceps purpurea]
MGPTRSRGAYRSRLFSHETGPDALRSRKGFSDVYLDDAVVLLVLAIASLGDSGDSGGDDAVDRPGLRSTRYSQQYLYAFIVSIL